MFFTVAFRAAVGSIGRRPVMLTGVVWFIVTCLATLLAQNIENIHAAAFPSGREPVLYWRRGLRRYSGVV